MGVGTIWRRILYLLRRTRAYEELAEEMQLHMDLRAAKLRDQGANEDVAARDARRRFGNPAAIRESSRETWGWRWLEEAWLDSKLSLGMLAKAPGFASIVVLTLGLDLQDPLLELLPEAYLESRDVSEEEIQTRVDSMLREAAASLIRFRAEPPQVSSNGDN